MTNEISWRVQLAVKPGQLDNFRELTAEMVETTRKETGVLSYERFVTGDGRFVHVYERYADSAAALAHLRKFGKAFGERFNGMVDRVQFAVYDIPSDGLKDVLDGFEATYLKRFGDFKYSAQREGRPSWWPPYH
jgi:quinol monooxygenase YgiN